MNFTPSQESVALVDKIGSSVKTFHHHFHILYDIAKTFNRPITYAEIGCYAGASACLMLQIPGITVYSIDGGEPISPMEACNNMSRFNTQQNIFQYIQGNSHDPNIIQKVRMHIPQGIDILFIDGGHGFNDVIQDFNNFAGAVNPGGYIVFDDYQDWQFSPEVRSAVDKIVSGLQGYEIIGSIPNSIEAKPAEVKNNNCFIIKKKIAKLAVVIATYQRPDGKTPGYLDRALQKISEQTFKDYQVFVMGDAYANPKELFSITNKYHQACCFNLPVSVERNKYPIGDFRLWCCGGLTAFITGVEKALGFGMQYVCHLDHDDWWNDNHLELINQVIEKENPFFICTASTYGNLHLPHQPLDQVSVPFYPVPGGMIASSSCVKYSETKLRYRDVFAATGKANPGDADMWFRLDAEMKIERKNGFFIRTLTCHHDEEGYAIRGR